MLDLFSGGVNKQTLASCSLYAPACTVAFANAHYLPAVNRAKILVRGNFHIHALSDNREREDTVGPYQKSLLYLVSRALEDMHKMPILGLLKAFDPDCNQDEHWNEPRIAQLQEELDTWQSFWWGANPPTGFHQDGNGGGTTNLHVVDTRQVSTGARRINPAHGTFDNDMDVVMATLGRCLGQALTVAPLNTDWNLDY